MIYRKQGDGGSECSAIPHNQKRPANTGLFVSRDTTSQKVSKYKNYGPKAA